MMRGRKGAGALSLAVAALSLLLPLSAGTEDFCSSSANETDQLTLRSDQLTVLISGYSTRRIPLLRSLATSYASLPSVAAVLVLWGNPSTPSRTLSRELGFESTVPIKVLRHPTPSLNARFLPRREIRTRAVAICDDDVEIDSKSLAFAFSVWGTHQDRIVGFFARSHDLDLERKTWIYTVHPDRYSIVLTKFMILRSDYLRRYSCGGEGTFAAARAVVERKRNCEDILMNFVVAMASGKGPLLVEGKRVRDWGDARNEVAAGKGGRRGRGAKEEVKDKGVRDVGLSTAEGHRRRRGDCIREFHRLMGVMPLRYSYGKVAEGVREQGLCSKGGKLVFCDRFR